MSGTSSGKGGGRTLLLLSGGIDSTLAAVRLLAEGCEVAALSIDYPGRPAGEIAAARSVAGRLPFSKVLEGTLEIRTAREADPASPAMEGFVPYRNLLFWAYAAHKAYGIGASAVAAGHERLDGESYTDASPDFFRRLEEVLRYSGDPDGSRSVAARFPLLSMTHDEIAALAAEKIEIVRLTWSCWRNGEAPCGECHACERRIQFLEPLHRSPEAPGR